MIYIIRVRCLNCWGKDCNFVMVLFQPRTVALLYLRTWTVQVDARLRRLSAILIHLCIASTKTLNYEQSFINTERKLNE